MWISEIIRARRRHRFISRAKHLVGSFASAVHEKLGNISGAEMERILTMAILIGIKRYSDHHPNLRHTISQIVGIDMGNGMNYEYDMDTENVVASQRRVATRRKSVAKSPKVVARQKK